jgi:Ser/Thr protein kinase RdoA (MazF antagonist)
MVDAIKEHPLAAAYNRLTPESVLGAVEGDGRRCTGRFLTLNSYENRVYQLELEDGRWIVGKFYRPGRWSRATILAEHRFLAELAAEEIPVASPIPLVDGESVGEVDGILFAVFPRIAGRTPQELGDDQVKMVGRLIARIHNVGARRDEPDRLRLTPQTYGRDNLRYLVENDVIPAEARDAFAATVGALVERIEPLFAEVPTHRLHGDCHLGNLIDTMRGFTFLDFDDMVIGPAVQDVWMLVPSYDEEGVRQRHVLLEAYAEMRRFEPRWLALVEPLRALRFVHYATWIARRWHDPTFQRTFAHFGTLLYWQKELQDLREQIARIDQSAYR